jgi:pimeloyl-ACP methyl ester carboxylesterase
MYLNTFTSGLDPLDMTELEEFASLLKSASELGIPHSPDVRYVSVNTIVRHQRFHFLEWGDPSNPTVLLLHGGNQSAHSWDLVSLHLSDRYHVLALDQRGHGDSEWNRGADYSVGAMAEDAEAFLEDRGVANPIIFGHSMGGMVTLALSSRRPALPKAVAIVDVGPELSERGTRMIGDFVQRNVEFDDLEEFLGRVDKYDPYRSRAHIERTVKYNLLRRADGRYVSKVDRRRYHTGGHEGRVRRLGAPSYEDIGRMDFPVLVVRGGESNVLEPEAAERFVAALPKGQLVTVPSCGHNVHSQNTPGFLQAIAPFLDEVTGA